MNNVISFSGGRTSAYMVHLIEQKRKAGEIDNVHYVFLDTGAEHPKTYEFIKNCVDHFGIDLVCLKADIPPELGDGINYQQVPVSEIGWNLDNWVKMAKKYGNPTIGAAHCTRNLKTTPYNKFCNDKFGRKNYISWLGIRIDEGRRLKGKENTKYLAEISQMEKSDIIGWWSEQPFDLEIDEHLGNCVFCVKKGVKKIALAQRNEPEKAEELQAIFAADYTRHMPYQELTKDAIYRGKMTLPQIAQTYEPYSDDEILMTASRSSGCTESCEVFGCQGDLFE